MKKRWLGVLALTVCAVLLSGCSAQDEDQSNVTLGEYKGLTLTASRTEYDDEDVEIQTKIMYFNYVWAEEGITDRPVENLDMTNIDYEGKKDGVAFGGGTAQGATLLIGSGQFIDGFEEGLIGVMPGETVDLNLNFPDPYPNNPDLAGQEVVFTVTVNFIPEMEDEGVEQIGIPGVTTVDGLRAYVREALEAQAQEVYMEAAENEIMSLVIANAVFDELPADMLAENRETYAAWLDRQAAGYGMTGEAYLSRFGMDYETTLDAYAEQYTKELLVVHAIADIEGLNISEEALVARMEEYAQTVGVDVEGLLVGGLTREDYRESFLYEDVMNFLLENSVSASVIVD